jgi:4-hydroxy-2-oxoheptanedioate aldolase
MPTDTTKLRPSRVLSKLRAGGVSSCIKLNLSDPRVAEIAARAGFDCIWTDREHVPNTLEQVENQIRAAKAYDVDTIVRVPRGAYSELVWPLEMDAAGVMVPHVMSAAEAKQIAYLTRFHPVGRRPLDGGNADGGYCAVPVADYLRQANDQRLVIVQIEDPEPLEELEQIASVPGIDMLFFGPGDFSQGIGHPGEMNHPRIIEARRRVASVAREHGKFAGTVGTLANLNELTTMGYQFVSVGADVIALVQAFSEIATAFGQAASSVGGAYSPE